MGAVAVAVLAALVAAGVGAVLYGASRRRLLAASIAALAGLAAMWAVAAALTASGWRDADGWIDCNDHCSSLQQVTGATLAGAILGAAATVLVAAVAALARGRAATPRG